MNKEQFTKYISENFDCSNEAANAIIEIFSESIYLAILEGYEVNLDHFGKFAVKNTPKPKKLNSHYPMSFGQLARNKSTPSKRVTYFSPAPDLKFAALQ